MLSTADAQSLTACYREMLRKFFFTGRNLTSTNEQAFFLFMQFAARVRSY